ncbi:MAG: radical SAM family heme chaperone HemW [Chloroflexi bacterium]|nr:radical SAM family heme chaperone HemW [Chloroflexota bacterium]
MLTTSLALYIHFPFCLSICPYCDFDRQATGFDRIDVYLAMVKRELARYTRSGERVHSIFFGGGTPSLLQAAQLAALIEAARGTFDVEPDAEITVECNPGDADLLKLREFRAAGATRLSFGVQSLDDRMLKLLGRRHSSNAARQAAGWARQAGFAFNLDFMFGLPGQTLAHWQHTLDQAVSLEPDHLSCYLLTLDERVPMGRDVAAGRLTVPDDDKLADMYEFTRTRLAVAGYEQYEVSNWARPGQASRHNLTYWRDGEWLGIGAGAASAYGGRRWKNTPVLERYIRSMHADGSAQRVEDEAPDFVTRLMDHVTLGLRLRQGIVLEEFRARFGADLREVLGTEGHELATAGVLECDGTRLRVPAERQMILNEILVRLEEPIAAYARRATSDSQIAAR